MSFRPLTYGLLAAALLAAPGLARAQSAAASCNKANLSIDTRMAQKDFFREFHNQDLVRNMHNLRQAAIADRNAGRFEECGTKAAILQTMVNNPPYARVALAEFQAKQASVTGGRASTVADGPRLSQQQLIGASLYSVNEVNLGTVSGLVYSRTGQPLYLTLQPAAGAPVSKQVLVPVGLLLVDAKPDTLYVAVRARDFWKQQLRTAS